MTEPPAVSVPSWPFRSLLFVPGHKPDWIGKAVKAGPDAVILDLEDSVPPELKSAARSAIRASLPELAQAGVGALVRINALDSGGLDDIMAVVTANLAGVLVPKADSAAAIRQLADTLSYAEGLAGIPHGSVAIMPIPETARGLYDARLLADASPRVRGLVTGFAGCMGGGDIVWAAGLEPTADGIEQVFMTSNIALASRAGDAPYPIAGIVGIDLADTGAVREMIGRAKRAGFTGVMVMHPSHVAIANAVYCPTDTEVAFAQGMVDAMAAAEAEGSGAVRYRGMMIDYANLLNARRVIADAHRYGPKETSRDGQ